MPSPSERLEILNRLERGELSIEQAAELLTGAQTSRKAAASPMDVLEQLERGEINPEEAAQQLGAAGASQDAKEESHTSRVEVIDPKVRRSRWWAVAIAAGSLLAVLAATWMRSDLQDGSLGLAFICAWAPLLMGILLIVLGWASRQSPWASVRIRSRRAVGHAEGNFNLDLPLPVKLTSQVLRFFGGRMNISGVDLEDIEGLLGAFEQAKENGQPIIIQTHSDDDDETVDIQIS